MPQWKNKTNRGASMEKNFIEALTVLIDDQLFAVLNAKQLPSDRRAKQVLLNGVRLSRQFDQFVVVEKFDSVNDELIAVDIDKASPIDTGSGYESTADIAFELTAAALGKLHHRSGLAVALTPMATFNFLHRLSGVQAQIHTHAGNPTAFDVTLLRVESSRTSLRDLELKHSYLESATVKIPLLDATSVQASLLAAHKTVYSETGKSVVVALRADALSGSKKKNQSHELNSAAQQVLMALVKHIAASLHIAQSAVQVLLIWPSVEADFKAAEWLNDTSTTMLKSTVSAGGLIALAELAALPGSIVQAIARVLPGVPTRIAHAGGIVEIMATAVGVTRAVKAIPVAQGKLFSHSI
jgi:hypothetical protein